MVAILEEWADEVCEEGRAGFVNLFPDIIGYGVRTRGGGGGRLGQRAGDLFLAEGKVVRKTREVDVSLGRGRGGREEVVQKGGVDAFRDVLVWEGGKAGLLSAASEFLGFPYRRWGKGGEVVGPVSKLGFLDGGEVGPAGGAHGRVVVRVPGGLEGPGCGVESLAKGGEEGRPPGFRPGGRPSDWGV